MKRILTPLALVALLALPTLALAQDAPSEPLGWSGVVAALLEELLPVLLNVALAAGTLLIGLIGNFVAKQTARVQNDTIRSALETLDEIARTKVLEIYQDAIDDLKAASADGKLTLEEARAAARTALHELTASLPRTLLDTLIAAAGGSIEALQEKYLMPAIEKAVAGTAVMNVAKSKVDVTADQRKLQERMLAARSRLGLSE